MWLFYGGDSVVLCIPTGDCFKVVILLFKVIYAGGFSKAVILLFLVFPMEDVLRRRFCCLCFSIGDYSNVVILLLWVFPEEGGLRG